MPVIYGLLGYTQVGCILGGIAILIIRGGVKEFIILCLIGLLIFMSSFYFLPKAKKVHNIRMAAKNKVLFD